MKKMKEIVSPDILMSQSGLIFPVKSIWSTRPVTMVQGLASESAGFSGLRQCLNTETNVNK